MTHETGMILSNIVRYARAIGGEERAAVLAQAIHAAATAADGGDQSAENVIAVLVIAFAAGQAAGEAAVRASMN